eukprot:14523947-Alexandrium_andersonii.AAC.1
MDCFEKLQEEKYSKLLSKDVYRRLQPVIAHIKPACVVLNGGCLVVPGSGLIWASEHWCLPCAALECSGFTVNVATG